MTHRFIARVVSLRRLRNSLNGNARHLVTTDKGTYNTMADAEVGSLIRNSAYADTEVMFTITSDAKLQIIDAVPVWECGDAFYSVKYAGTDLIKPGSIAHHPTGESRIITALVPGHLGVVKVTHRATNGDNEQESHASVFNLRVEHIEGPTNDLTRLTDGEPPTGDEQ